MFNINRPCCAPWVLSHFTDEKCFSIPKNTIEDIKPYHFIGIDFLYQVFKKKFKGAILNEEKDMNMQLQVATFLNPILRNTEAKFLALIIAPDSNIVNWHYHLTVHGGLRVQIITPKTCPEDFDQEHGLALLLSFTNIKLSDCLNDYDYFCVVIDDFDQVASKLFIKKLHGRFNIGLTHKNFYDSPDQKLQWTMLNWCNPGCVGKLGDFYKIDNDNFANCRDNYRHWWFRLTWNFCDGFKKVSKEERQEYLKTLSEWANSHHLIASNDVKLEKSKRKRKHIEIVDDTEKVENEECKVKEETEAVKIEGSILGASSQTSSQDTIIYSPIELEKEQLPNYVKLPSMDENPILNSIIQNLEKSPESIFMSPLAKYVVDEPNCSKAFRREPVEDDNVLLSIINANSYGENVFDRETKINFKKEEIRSQIFSDEPCTSKIRDFEEDSQFFQSLIDSDVPVEGGKSSKTLKKTRSEDVEAILRDTEVLLKQ